MNKILTVLAAGLFAISCNDNTATDVQTPQYTDIKYNNLKGKVQRLEEVPYKVDSATGQPAEIDSCCTTIELYDEKGYHTNYTSRNNKLNITDEISFTRFDDGMIKEHVTTTDGRLKTRQSVQKGMNGSYGDSQVYDSTGKMEFYYTDVISDTVNKLILGWKRYKPDSTLQSIGAREFDGTYFKNFTLTDSAGKVLMTMKAKNDANGNQIELTTTEMKGDSTTTKLVTYKYELVDEKGNWTQRTEFNDKGKPVQILKRTITYYKD